MKNEEFVIRYYGKSELAMLYFPDDNKENALYKLRIELKLNPNLRHLVSKNARRYSPKDVKQITDELGDPYWEERKRLEKTGEERRRAEKTETANFFCRIFATEIGNPTEILDTPKEITITPRVFSNTPKVMAHSLVNSE